MKILYDSEVDALSIVFKEAQSVTRELGEGIAIDIDIDGNLVAIEILDAAKRLGSPDMLSQVSFEKVPA